MDRFTQNMDNTANAVKADNCACKEYGSYRKIYLKNTMPDSRVLVFLAGLGLGMVFFYLSGIGLIGAGKLPSVFMADNIARLHDLDFNTAGLFEYVVGERIGQLLFLLICATSFLRVFFSYALLGWSGFELGIILFTFVYQHGMKGLLFSVALLFPHGIFYALAFLLLFHKYWGVDKNAYHNYAAHNRFTKLKKAAAILLIWLVGILSEVYINAELVETIAVFF